MGARLRAGLQDLIDSVGWVCSGVCVAEASSGVTGDDAEEALASTQALGSCRAVCLRNQRMGTSFVAHFASLRSRSAKPCSSSRHRDGPHVIVVVTAVVGR